MKSGIIKKNKDVQTSKASVFTRLEVKSQDLIEVHI